MSIRARLSLVIAALVLVLALVVGCSKTPAETTKKTPDPAKDKAKAAQCLTDGKKDGDTCKACCKSAGYNGHMYVGSVNDSGPVCKCL